MCKGDKRFRKYLIACPECGGLTAPGKWCLVCKGIGSVEVCLQLHEPPEDKDQKKLFEEAG